MEISGIWLEVWLLAWRNSEGGLERVLGVVLGSEFVDNVLQFLYVNVGVQFSVVMLLLLEFNG